MSTRGMKAASGDLRFDVALSFPGEHRSRVEGVARELADTLGEDRVLYDKWYSAEFARPNLDVYLPKLYHRQSRLLVLFLCGEYAEKEWCGLEWRVARDLLKQGRDDRLMLLRLDQADIPGLYSIDGYLDIQALTDDQVAQAILKRLSESVAVPPTRLAKKVRDLRALTTEDIESRCGKIRILTMEQPIELAGVYTDVNVLERRTANLRKTRDELFREANLNNVERFGISAERLERVPGLNAFQAHQHIMIYGKPGAGKTTFLKRLAVECARGRLRPELVPIFVTLKDFSEADRSPSLFEYVHLQWNKSEDTRTVLKEGRALILLDGLDEVRDHDFVRVRNAIETFTTEYHRCWIALTCRIAAREYAFERFTEVEMADFTTSQIEAFATRWFGVRGEAKRARIFMERLKANAPIFELASSPLLLTLLCLVFQERNDFDGTRAELYGEGLEILLRQWDAKRGVERDRPYGLTITDMEILLSEIAYRRFLKSEYFFDQQSLGKQVEAFFAARTFDQVDRELRAERVLDSIESHLGLLVQRAVRVYSFSHLTFQEYLTAWRVSKKRNLLSEIGPLVSDRRWREVWLLLVTMVDADELVIELKQQVDALVAKSPKIQDCLRWCQRKAAADSGPYSAPAKRAFFLALARAFDRDLAENLGGIHFDSPYDGSVRGRFTGGNFDAHFSAGIALNSDLERDLDVALAIQSATQSEAGRGLRYLLTVNKQLALDHSLARSLAFAHAQMIELGMPKPPSRIRDVDRGFALNRFLDAELAAAGQLARHLAPDLLPELSLLRSELETLRKQFSSTTHRVQWQRRWPSWLTTLRAAATKYCDIGFEWKFTETERRLISDYLRAAFLLVECTNTARGLIIQTKRHVIETMVLPK